MKIKKYLKKEVIIRMSRNAFLKLVFAALLTLAWNLWINKDQFRNPVMFVATVVGALYIFMAWLGFLRLDGVHMPRVFSYRRKNKDSKTAGGMMADAINTEPDADDELSDEDKDFAAFASWTIAGVISIIVGCLF